MEEEEKEEVSEQAPTKESDDAERVAAGDIALLILLILAILSPGLQ